MKQLILLFLFLLPAGPVRVCAQARVPEFSTRRSAMIQRDIEGRGIRDPAVLKAMATVPRERFVPEKLQDLAYRDGPLPIGHDQTISQPYIVAAMTELLQLQPTDRVLEVGTGSGYQAAVLAEVAAEVYTIEIIPALARQAKNVLGALGYTNVVCRTGDGYAGWPEHAPFDGIMVTAAPEQVPRPLIDQLKPGARLVIPVGDRLSQVLMRITRTAEDEFKEEQLLGCRFVPLVGNHGWHEENG